ncbi:MAG: hypothetical protein KatS3mg105_1337 [Gemmatales bacterium]|nr:MAG: hypothetical protein KatS3mg105_1337 [Gemmatales bacterium]
MPNHLLVYPLFPLLLTGLAVAGHDDKSTKPTNRLARESSPYLLQHAHNPVDWYPWGPEAFEKAKKEGKLVFLSIGYSSCHWCHVMERESFSNPKIAKMMNDWFVCIKVDREERPDIDHIYMTALQVLGRNGGWPLSMFLTPDGKPIFGGTYWPPEDKEVDGGTLRGFTTVMKLVHDWYSDKKEELEKHADKLAEATSRALIGTARGNPLIDINRDLVAGVIEELKLRYDPVYGGFGQPGRNFVGPKFPVPPDLDLLLLENARRPSKELKEMITNTLDHMARGGIYDQLGGGFHRYSTERTWTVPHFEKMLYDNAQLVEIYAHAYQQTKNPFYQRIVDETLAFIAREMTSPEGGFYSALDADSEGQEGRFYVWTPRELADALKGENEKLFRKVYGADGKTNFESKYYILTLPKPYAEVAKELKITEAELHRRLQKPRHKLLTIRSKRPRPFLDTKILTAWNGQMIAGYAVAGQTFENAKYVSAAERAADLLLDKLRTKEGRLLRTYAARPGEKPKAKLNAYLDDYAFFVHGLLCLHDATNNKKWLDHAQRLTDKMIEWHLDKKHGGFFYTSNDHESLFARAKDQYDGAQPSGNSMAARNLVRLWLKTKDKRYREMAERSFKTFAAPMKLQPAALCTMASALQMFLDAQARQDE